MNYNSEKQILEIVNNKNDTYIKYMFIFNEAFNEIKKKKYIAINYNYIIFYYEL
jgi:hypothetical protein